MVIVRVPKEIRDYQEKVIAGLSWRKVIAFGFSAIVFGVMSFIRYRYQLNEEVFGYVIIFMIAPIMFWGYFTKNGMNFEEYAVVILKKFIYPACTNYKSSNSYRELYKEIIEEEEKKYDKKKYIKYEKKAAYERTYLMQEAKEKGDKIDMSKLDEMLLTVRKPKEKKKKDSNKKDKKDKKDKKSKARLVAEEVEKKRNEDSSYIPSKQEGKMLLKYSKEIEKEKKKIANIGSKKAKNKDNEMKKRRKAKSYIPKSVIDDLPYIADYEEGLMEVEPNVYSKMYRLRNINFLTAEQDDEEEMIANWASFLNTFSEEITVSVYINNRLVSKKEKEEEMLFQMTGGNKDSHREELNKTLKKQLENGNNDISKELYLGITIECNNPYEALVKFRYVEDDMYRTINMIGSEATLMSTYERLELVHDKMRKGKEGQFHMDYNALVMHGMSSKDYVCPSEFDFKKKDYYKIDESYYGRVLYVTNIPTQMKDTFVKEMTDFKFPLTLTFSINPVEEAKAIRMIKQQLTGMEKDKLEAHQRAAKAGLPQAVLNTNLVRSYEQALQMLEDVEVNGQKVFFATILMEICGSTLEELEERTEQVNMRIRKFTCQLLTLDNQQREAYKVCFPMGVPAKNSLYVERTLTSESLAIYIPFTVQEMFQPTGTYYGINQVSKNMIFIDRTRMKTGSGFTLGSSGSGKSFACKREMLFILCKDDETGLLVIDPENEYILLAKFFGGTIISLESAGDIHINPFDMDENYGLDEKDNPELISLSKKKEKALKKKSEYIMSITQYQLKDDNGNISFTPSQKAIIDQCVKRVYEDYLEHDFDKQYLPTYKEFQKELETHRGKNAGIDELVDAINYYTNGSMDLFSYHTNVELDNRFIVFNIRNLGEGLKQMALLITMDFIWNKMLTNFGKKIRTYCYIDEIHVLFNNAFSERYIEQFYKRGRKYGLITHGITQDVDELLSSDMARRMIKNSEFIMMLNQKGDNLTLLADLLHISQAQLKYINNAETGSGLIYAQGNIIPFLDRFPRNSYLYELLDTDFDESVSDEEIQALVEKLKAKNDIKETTQRTIKLRNLREEIDRE